MRFMLLLLPLLLAFPAMAADVWIDVRTPAEYKAGHIKNAINIPHERIASEIEKLGLDKNTRIRLYCGSGHRAGIAKKALQKSGYRQVINDGGYEDIRIK